MREIQEFVTKTGLALISIGDNFKSIQKELIEKELEESFKAIEKAIDNIMEVNEMEDKKIKVRCINNNAARDLLCTDKIYTAFKENERGNRGFWGKCRFEKVEPEKKVKEYSLMDVFKEKEGTEFKIEGEDNLYKVVNGNNRFYEIMYCDKYLLEAKFIKVEEPVSTAEAFKALEEGKTIKSIYNNNEYKLIDNKLKVLITGTFKYKNSNYITSQELENKWIIKGDK